MRFIFLEDAPSQRYTFQANGIDYDFQFMYNQMADRWSITIWPSGEDCPIRAGYFLSAGVDLIDVLSGDDVMLVLDRAGVDGSGFTWYQRLVEPLGDGLPPTVIVFATKAELEALVQQNTTGGLIC